MLTEEKYLESLSLDQLLDFLEDAIRCAHYCPCECGCFEAWQMRISYQDIKNHIREKYEKS